MKAVSTALITTIKELQNLSKLSGFALAGGTNLSLRFDHRESIDIDLMSSDIVGLKGFESIKKELDQYFGKRVNRINLPCDINDQYCFLRCFIDTEDTTIKVDFLQNMKFTEPIEVHEEIRLVSIVDVGLCKLVSASSRLAIKDIYDLDYITDKIDLIELFSKLKEKEKLFNKEEDKNIFQLDKDKSPVEDPNLLLSFDNARLGMKSRPNHTDDLMKIMEGHKSWNTSKFDYRKKVRALFSHLNLEFPKNQSEN